MRIIDVTLSITNHMISFPGDPKPEVKKVFAIENGDAANVSNVNLSSHTGTHIDAPSHFLKDGATIDKLPLELFTGYVKVLNVSDADVITRSYLEKKDIESGDRIFFKTKNSKYLDIDEFNKNFSHLSLDGAEYLVQKGVKVAGIDYLSIEGYGSQDYMVHKTLLKNGIIIIEGLDLRQVDEGEYEYMALPLKIKDCDAAPARVVLRK